jgi:hypothetical protein
MKEIDLPSSLIEYVPVSRHALASALAGSALQSSPDFQRPYLPSCILTHV